MTTIPPAVRRDDPRLTVYWHANQRLIRWLLALWLLVSLVGSILLAEPLNRVRIGNLPFGFWLAQQGSIYIFVVLIFYYAWRMDQLDRQLGLDRDADAAAEAAAKGEGHVG